MILNMVFDTLYFVRQSFQTAFVVNTLSDILTPGP